jgi:hypothetical protein
MSIGKPRCGCQPEAQATQNLPQFRLRIDDQGDIYAEGPDELIYGRLSQQRRLTDPLVWR